jgi:Mor family transcriptional regulator
MQGMTKAGGSGFGRVGIELLAETADYLTTKLRGDGVANAEAIARATVEHLAEYWGGGSFYLPLARSVRRQQRDEQIRLTFDGRNYVELARQHGLSERAIRYIVDGRNRPAAATKETHR